MNKIKLILTVLFALAALSGCAGSGCAGSEYDKTKQTDADTQYPFGIYEVTYKGHDYIVFGGTEYGSCIGMHSGVVHNPECRKCKDK